MDHRARPLPLEEPADAQDRRSARRYSVEGLQVGYRLQGGFRRHRAELLDFNRFGLAMQTQTPMPVDHYLLLTLDHEEVALSGVVGVIHNCVRQAAGYRCGVRFRTQHSSQADAERVAKRLLELEARLAFAEEPAADPAD